MEAAGFPPSYISRIRRRDPVRKRDRKHPLHLIFPRLADICLFKKKEGRGATREDGTSGRKHINGYSILIYLMGLQILFSLRHKLMIWSNFSKFYRLKSPLPCPTQIQQVCPGFIPCFISLEPCFSPSPFRYRRLKATVRV